MGLVFIAVCFAVYFASPKTHTLDIPVDERMKAEDFRFDFDNDLLKVASAVVSEGHLKVKVQAQKPGRDFLEVTDSHNQKVSVNEIRVNHAMTVVDENTGNFTGDLLVSGLSALYFLAVSVLVLRFFFSCRGSALYSYSAILAAGVGIFTGFTGLLLLYNFLKRLTDPTHFSMRSTYSNISQAGINFAVYTAPFVLIFAVLLIISNAELLRHERFRFRNILGILLGLIMIGGEVLAYRMTWQFTGSERAFRIHNTIVSVYGTAFTYFECILFAAVLCGFLAARHQPPFDRDYIIILGCGFRKDGSLPPLLRGRVDRAVRFRREQMEAGGKQALLIPSGGQGKNETMAESEAMYRYLINVGIPQEDILQENQSKNTYQNMEFSKKIINDPEAKVAFATTNYHVFRSGIWASLAGLEAEGIGSSTKWWFWPNAFIRECVGLFVNRIRQEINMLLLLVLLFGVISYLMT